MSIEATRLVDWYDEDGFKEGTKAPHKWVLQAAEELRRLRDENAALRQAIEQAAKQEPVAWLHNMIEGNVITHEPTLDIKRHPERWTPLYTAPPRKEWVGLTDDEILVDGDSVVSDYSGLIQFARAIEAKLKEKNSTTLMSSTYDDTALLRQCLEALSRSDYLGWQCNLALIKELKERLR